MEQAFQAVNKIDEDAVINENENDINKDEGLDNKNIEDESSETERRAKADEDNENETNIKTEGCVEGEDKNELLVQGKVETENTATNIGEAGHTTDYGCENETKTKTKITDDWGHDDGEANNEEKENDSDDNCGIKRELEIKLDNKTEMKTETESRTQPEVKVNDKGIMQLEQEIENIFKREIETEIEMESKEENMIEIETNNIEGKDTEIEIENNKENERNIEVKANEENELEPETTDITEIVAESHAENGDEEEESEIFNEKQSRYADGIEVDSGAHSDGCEIRVQDNRVNSYKIGAVKEYGIEDDRRENCEIVAIDAEENKCAKEEIEKAARKHFGETDFGTKHSSEVQSNAQGFDQENVEEVNHGFIGRRSETLGQGYTDNVLQDIKLNSNEEYNTEEDTCGGKSTAEKDNENCLKNEDCAFEKAREKDHSKESIKPEYVAEITNEEESLKDLSIIITEKENGEMGRLKKETGETELPCEEDCPLEARALEDVPEEANKTDVGALSEQDKYMIISEEKEEEGNGDECVSKPNVENCLDELNKEIVNQVNLQIENTSQNIDKMEKEKDSENRIDAQERNMYIKEETLPLQNHLDFIEAMDSKIKAEQPTEETKETVINESLYIDPKLPRNNISDLSQCGDGLVEVEIRTDRGEMVGWYPNIVKNYNTFPLQAEANFHDTKRNDRLIFATINMLSTKCTSEAEIKRVQPCDDKNLESFKPTEPNIKDVPMSLIRSRRDSISSSATSLASGAESKKSVLKVNGKASNHALSKLKQVTFKIDQRHPDDTALTVLQQQQQKIVPKEKDGVLTSENDHGDSIINGTGEGERVSLEKASGHGNVQLVGHVGDIVPIVPSVSADNCASVHDYVDEADTDVGLSANIEGDPSLEIDLMEFVNTSQGCTATSGSVKDHQALPYMLDGNKTDEETITEGVCRSSQSVLEDASIHRLSSLESLPNDEEGKDLEQCATVAPTERLGSSTDGDDAQGHEGSLEEIVTDDVEVEIVSAEKETVARPDDEIIGGREELTFSDSHKAKVYVGENLPEKEDTYSLSAEIDLENEESRQNSESEYQNCGLQQKEHNVRCDSYMEKTEASLESEDHVAQDEVSSKCEDQILLNETSFKCEDQIQQNETSLKCEDQILQDETSLKCEDQILQDKTSLKCEAQIFQDETSLKCEDQIQQDETSLKCEDQIQQDERCLKCEDQIQQDETSLKCEDQIQQDERSLKCEDQIQQDETSLKCEDQIQQDETSLKCEDKILQDETSAKREKNKQMEHLMTSAERTHNQELVKYLRDFSNQDEDFSQADTLNEDDMLCDSGNDCPTTDDIEDASLIWGKTAHDLKTYAEEFRSLTSVDSSCAAHKRAAGRLLNKPLCGTGDAEGITHASIPTEHNGVLSKVHDNPEQMEPECEQLLDEECDRKIVSNSHTETIYNMKNMSPKSELIHTEMEENNMTNTDKTEKLVEVENLEYSNLKDEEFGAQLSKQINKAQETEDKNETIVPPEVVEPNSATLQTNDNEPCPENISKQILSNAPSLESGQFEILVVPPNDSEAINGSASVPSQIILFENTSEKKRHSQEDNETAVSTVVDSSSRENTSRLEFSHSISQISQFDATLRAASTCSKPRKAAKHRDEKSIQCSGRSLHTLKEERVKQSLSEVYAADSENTGLSCSKVTFILPDDSSKYRDRSASVPRSGTRPRSRSNVRARSRSVSAHRHRRNEGFETFKITKSGRRKVEKDVLDVEGVPVYVMKDQSHAKLHQNASDSIIEKVVSSDGKKLATLKINASQCLDHQNETGAITTNKHLSRSSYTEIDDDKSEDDDDDDDDKTMATTIESFHSQSVFPSYVNAVTSDADQSCPNLPLDTPSHQSVVALPRSSSSVKFGDQEISLPKVDDAGWFKYREEFGNLFATSPVHVTETHVGCCQENVHIGVDGAVTSIPLTAVGVKSNEEAYHADKYICQDSEPAHNKDIPVSQSQSFPVSKKEEASRSENDNSLPQDDNSQWFGYRKQFTNLFPTEFSVSAASAHVNDSLHSDAHAPSSHTVDTAKVYTRAEAYKTIDELEIAPAETNGVNNEESIQCADIHTPNTHVISEVKADKIDTKQILPSELNDNTLLSNTEMKNRIGFLHSSNEAPQNDLQTNIHVQENKEPTEQNEVKPDFSSEPIIDPVLMSNATEPQQINSLELPLTEAGLPKPSATEEEKAEPQTVENVCEQKAHWFNYRKKFSNLFGTEGSEDSGASTYKRYFANTSKYNLGMLRDDYDDPPARRKEEDDTLYARSKVFTSPTVRVRSSSTQGAHATEASRADFDKIPGLGDGAVGDCTEKELLSLCSDKDESCHDSSVRRRRRKKMPPINPHREHFVGMVLQGGPEDMVDAPPPTRPATTPNDAVDGTTLDSPATSLLDDSYAELSQRSQRRRRERSTPRVRHTRSSAHRQPVEEHTSPITQPSNRLTPVDIGNGQLQSTAVNLHQRLVPLPEIQPTVETLAPLPHGCMKRPPSGRRVNKPKLEARLRIRRESKSPQHENAAKRPCREPTTDTEGAREEEKLLEEASGGFDKRVALNFKDIPLEERLGIRKKKVESRLKEGAGDVMGGFREPAGDISSYLPPSCLKPRPPEAVTEGQVMVVKISEPQAVPQRDLPVKSKEKKKFKNAKGFLMASIPRAGHQETYKEESYRVHKPKTQIAAAPWDEFITSHTFKVDLNRTDLSVHSPRSSESHNPDTQEGEEEEDDELQRIAEQKAKQKKIQDMKAQRMSIARLLSFNTKNIGSANITANPSKEKTVNKKPRNPSQPKKKHSRHSSIILGPDSQSGLGASPSAIIRRRSSGSPTGKGRQSLERSKVFAEGHYHPASNVLNVVVKPVNVGLPKDRLNLKVQVHRGEPNQITPLAPHPPTQEKPDNLDAVRRKIKLRRHPQPPLPVLARNIVELRAINPPFNTTSSPEAHRRFQTIFSRQKIL